MAYDQGVPSLSAAVRVTVNVIRNRNGPIFRLDDYAEEISEFEAIGRSVLRVRADDADNVSNSYLLRQYLIGNNGPRSAVGNVSGNRCKSDCRSRGREFDPGPVSYFRED